jgi:protein CLEC16A
VAEAMATVEDDHASSAEEDKFGAFEPYPEGIVDRLLLLLQRYPTCRLVTLQVAVRVLVSLVEPRVNASAPGRLLTPRHMAQAERAYHLAIADLRNKQYGTMGDVFLDMFDDEVFAMQQAQAELNIERLAQSTFVLLPVVHIQVPGLDLSRRMACTDTDHTRKAIQMFLLTRNLLLYLRGEDETSLPLERSKTKLEVNQSLDLTDEDVIACGVKTAAGQRPVSRYLVVDDAFMVLVEPDQTRIGWAVVRAVHSLMCVEAKMTKTADNRVLQVAIRTSKTQQDVMHLVFDDHIRCLAARQHLERGRTQVRAKMMEQVNELLWPEGREEASEGAFGAPQEVGASAGK